MAFFHCFCSAYGESVFLTVQTWIIAYLVQMYAGRTAQALAYSAAVGGSLALLMSPAIPMSILQIMQGLVMPNMALARVRGTLTFLKKIAQSLKLLLRFSFRSDFSKFLEHWPISDLGATMTSPVKNGQEN